MCSDEGRLVFNSKMSGVMKAIIGLLILCAIVTVISVTALLVALGYAEKLDDDVDDETKGDEQ